MLLPKWYSTVSMHNKKQNFHFSSRGQITCSIVWNIFYWYIQKDWDLTSPSPKLSITNLVAWSPFTFLAVTWSYSRSWSIRYVLRILNFHNGPWGQIRTEKWKYADYIFLNCWWSMAQLLYSLWTGRRPSLLIARITRKNF
jgi:hypothetical protein